MIIQVAGIEANKPCDRCTEGKGPFRGCYVIPTDVPLHLRQSVLGCANCHYKCQQAYCSLKPWSLKTYPELTVVQPSQEAPAQPVAQPKRRLSEETKLPERRSLRIMLKRTAPSYTFGSRPSRTQSIPKKRIKIIGSRSEQCPSPPSDARTTPGNAFHQINPAACDNTSDANPVQFLQLETWEIAPGRVRDERSNTIDNFAFSNAYLAQNHTIQISREVSFQVITIKPGTVHEWQACTKTLRLCSVASGKLQVKIYNQEFPMGPNGMIRIRPGIGCTVMNKLYVDAMVHVTIMPSDLYG
ncbi:hypothetical protein F5Y13DRAFT_162850 [Hypoxylon sp. FL1857]|nr:hypothetical protein F5Y13DRAFT_162850 [Hypoxylon sp. FL1857]